MNDHEDTPRHTVRSSEAKANPEPRKRDKEKANTGNQAKQLSAFT